MTHQKILENGIVIESFSKMLVLNEKDEVLVLTIGEYKDHPEKSFTPDLPGGQVEIGDDETERDGAIRETQEETGIIIDPKDVFLGYSRTGMFEGKSVSGFLYVARLNYTPEITISWEHSAYEWVALKDLFILKEFRPFYKVSVGYVVDNKLISPISSRE